MNFESSVRGCGEGGERHFDFKMIARTLVIKGSALAKSKLISKISLQNLNKYFELNSETLQKALTLHPNLETLKKLDDVVNIV